MEPLTSDICIVGSGPAGALLGRELARRGVRTVILESGPAVAGDARFGDLNRFTQVGPLDYPLNAMRMRAVGGTSHWTGQCPRLHESDFESATRYGFGDDWPISYADIEPYYCQAESTLEVAGASDARYFPPRSRPLPYPSPFPGIDELRTALALERTGLWFEPIPMSRRGGVGGAVRMQDDCLPEFQRLGGQLVADATVTRLETDRSGSRVTAAHFSRIDGTQGTAQAARFVVACGAIETPRLLLLSRSTQHPNGIGNASGLVGKRFMEHFQIDIVGVGAPNRYAYDHPLGMAMSQQDHDALKRAGGGGVVWGVMILARRPADIAYASDSHGSALLAEIRREFTPQITVSALMEPVPTPANCVTLDPHTLDPLGNPVPSLAYGYAAVDDETAQRVRMRLQSIAHSLALRSVTLSPAPRWGSHLMGTCRMGRDARTSVATSDLRVHGIENLYLSGASVFVTSGTANPTLTIAALALRLAGHLLAP
jgi:choline dehydrogenase-like flavoprotein